MPRDEGTSPATWRELGAEKRRSSAADRRRRFAGLHDFSAGRGLEVGPLDAPLTDPQVHDVRYVDVYDAAGLRAYYADDPNVVLELVPEIDFALIQGETTRSLAEATRPGAPYDWVVASHVVEHVPDLIGWLRQIAEVTADGGALVLAVPDRRYTFDRLRPPTTTGEALAAYEAGLTRPDVRAVYDFFATAVVADTGALRAGERPPGEGSTMYRREDVDAALARVRAGEYVDCHVWTFTPQAFLSQIRELRGLDLCEWYVEQLVEPPDDLEFHAVLRRIPRSASDSTASFDEPPLSSDLPDWLFDEWTAFDRASRLEGELGRLEEKVRVLRRRNRRLRARIERLETPWRARVGARLAGRFGTFRGRMGRPS